MTGRTRSELRVASVGGAAPTFPARKFEPLLNRGLDITLFLYRQCTYPAERAVLKRYPSRVKYLRKKTSIWRSITELSAHLLRKGVTSPSKTSKLIAAIVSRHGLNRKALGCLRRLFPYFGEGFDVVHLEDGWLAQELLDLVLLKKALGFKVIVSFRGGDLLVNSLSHADTCKTLLQVSDDVHFVCEALMLRARDLGLPKSRGRVIHPGVDPAVFDRGATPYPPPKDGTKGALRLLSVGRLDWGKGYEYGLKAASIVAQRGLRVHYDIVGGGILRDALRYAVWQMHLEGAVEFHGDLPRDRILPLMRQADIYIQSSVREGLPNTVLEAQSFMIPVVCTDAGGSAEAVEDGITGFVVPTRDPQALADKIYELAGDEDLRVRMGIQGRKRVLARFTLEQQAARFFEFYNEVANR